MQNFKPEIKLLLVVAAVSAALAVAGILLLQAGLGPSSPAPTPMPAPVAQTPPPVPSPQPQALEGWQTYRNTEFGFEVKYPPYSKPTENVNSDGIFYNIVTIDLPFENETILQQKSHYTVSAVSTQFRPGCSESFDLDAYERRVGDMTIDGVEFARYENSTLEDVYKSDTYVAEVGGRCFSITAFVLKSADETKHRLVLNQILSTFRFVE